MSETQFARHKDAQIICTRRSRSQQSTMSATEFVRGVSGHNTVALLAPTPLDLPRSYIPWPAPEDDTDTRRSRSSDDECDGVCARRSWPQQCSILASTPFDIPRSYIPWPSPEDDTDTRRPMSSSYILSQNLYRRRSLLRRHSRADDVPMMNPVMLCRKTSGMPRWPQSWMKCVAFSADSLNRNLVGPRALTRTLRATLIRTTLSQSAK